VYFERRKPYWWQNTTEWEETLNKYDIRFDVHTTEPPYFIVANAATRKVKGSRYVPLTKLLCLDVTQDGDQKALEQVAKQVKLDGLCDGMDTLEIYTRLDRVRKIRDADVVTITVDNELEDVVDIFSRLNSRGTRVTEADIYLGVVAARTPGWVRENFLPFVVQLRDSGYDVSPNLVFPTLTAVGKKAVRYRSIDDTFWNASSIHPAWERTKKAWTLAIKRLNDYGISGNALLPADNALVILVAILDKFPRDLKEVSESPSAAEVLARLLDRIRYVPPLEAKDFTRNYGDARFGRLLLYLLIFKNGASDWDESGSKIGFDGGELLAGFQPQFHHIFPKKFLEGHVVENSIDALANIAIIGPTINIRISKQNPMDYIPKYNITITKLKQQYISSDITTTTVNRYLSWSEIRAEGLAKAGNDFLERLRGSLPLPKVSVASKNQEHAFEAD
jgi:hypothetical protein